MDLRELTEMPDPQFVMSAEGHRIATYSWGDDADPTVIAVHGFASSTRDNWVNTGWVRELLDAGFRVIGMDQRGHGASDKPHDAHQYSMRMLTDDVIAVLDTYLVTDAVYLGYSLGGRVGWQVMADHPEHISRGVLGGIPDGKPLRRLKVDEARAFLDDGTTVQDKTTARYVSLASRLPGNDLDALLALAEGMNLADDVPPVNNPPSQPTLIATGSDDAILEDSRLLQSSVPNSEFFEIPARHHINAPGSRAFREAGIAFLRG